MIGSQKESIVFAMFNKLRDMHPWYSWAVGAISGDRLDGFEWRGSMYFMVEDRRSDPDKVQDYLVVYDDSNTPRAQCQDIGYTALVFKGSDGCNSDYIQEDDNIITHKSCFEEAFHVLIGRWWVSQDGWGYIIAAPATPNYGLDVCSVMDCARHGKCKQIPFTLIYGCICDENYYGFKLLSCDQRVDMDNTTEELMCQLREKVNITNGVPTIVDVFFSVEALSKKFEEILKKMHTSFAHTNMLINYSALIYHVEDLADLYAQLQKNELTFDQFGRMIDRYLHTVTGFELQNRMHNMILAEGLLDTKGKDIFVTVKRQYVSENGGGCSAKYNEDIKTFRDHLSFLDQVLGEALLLHQKWLLYTKGTTDALRDRYREKAKYFRDLFKDRPQVYSQYWKSYSCGILRVDGADISCKEQLTFQGMTLTVRCEKQRQPTPSQVTCEKIGNALKWDSQPQCKFVWGDWGSWSDCSKTCGGGVKYRYRNC